MKKGYLAKGVGANKEFVTLKDVKRGTDYSDRCHEKAWGKQEYILHKIRIKPIVYLRQTSFAVHKFIVLVYNIGIINSLILCVQRRLMYMDTTAKEIWLNYFNKILFEKGLITEKEKNKMIHLIYKECSACRR